MIDYRKICPKCTTSLPHEDFYNDKSRKDGKANVCKKCKNSRLKAWLKLNPDKKRKYKKTPNAKKRRALRSKLRQYGLSTPDYKKMVESQKGLCLICHETCPTFENLCIDHCHTTGKVRGLLCNGCNSGLGFFKDNPYKMISAIEYLKAHRPILSRF